MADERKSTSGGDLQKTSRVAYSTFPEVATHGPRDKRCFHGKPEDWMRVKAKRTFGGRIK